MIEVLRNNIDNRNMVRNTRAMLALAILTVSSCTQSASSNSDSEPPTNYPSASEVTSGASEVTFGDIVEGPTDGDIIESSSAVSTESSSQPEETATTANEDIEVAPSESKKLLSERFTALEDDPIDQADVERYKQIGESMYILFAPFTVDQMVDSGVLAIDPSIDLSIATFEDSPEMLTRRIAARVAMVSFCSDMSVNGLPPESEDYLLPPEAAEASALKEWALNFADGSAARNELLQYVQQYKDVLEQNAGLLQTPTYVILDTPQDSSFTTVFVKDNSSVLGKGSMCNAIFEDLVGRDFTDEDLLAEALGGVTNIADGVDYSRIGQVGQLAN